MKRTNPYQEHSRHQATNANNQDMNNRASGGRLWACAETRGQRQGQQEKRELSKQMQDTKLELRATNHGRSTLDYMLNAYNREYHLAYS
ncbi:Hypothetical predicted protein [Pelobates cultripes]|uniref:Uncharacterized protein n=1 Tax=Pelobates cultripes TaxID=61616 RepID=A0AAD1WQG5_PELCU|nr:Hypothetical predicted protein [Pelobates cultripes]